MDAAAWARDTLSETARNWQTPGARRTSMPSTFRVALGLAALTTALLPGHLVAQGTGSKTPADDKATPVEGPSWLTKLGVTLSQTSIGRGSGRYGPTTRPNDPAISALVVPSSVTLTGGDLYRLNCQACHGLSGAGAPPEVKSATDPIRGVPIDVLRKQMKAQQQPESEAATRSTPARIRAGLLLRMHQGGQRMPARDHLTETELGLVFDYLTALADKHPDAAARRETVNWAQLGQHVVKGTCHICHDAVGPRPTDKAMLAGAIPSLASLMQNQSVADFVVKARSGAPVTLPSLTFTHRGRMPVFDYLKDQEISAAYMYLASHPPRK
jgi:mono/diheme cytochrome c family protein